jgi:hypothetical protein
MEAIMPDEIKGIMATPEKDSGFKPPIWAYVLLIFGIIPGVIALVGLYIEYLKKENEKLSGIPRSAGLSASNVVSSIGEANAQQKSIAQIGERTVATPLTTYPVVNSGKAIEWTNSVPEAVGTANSAKTKALRAKFKNIMRHLVRPFEDCDVDEILEKRENAEFEIMLEALAADPNDVTLFESLTLNLEKLLRLPPNAVGANGKLIADNIFIDGLSKYIKAREGKSDEAAWRNLLEVCKIDPENSHEAFEYAAAATRTRVAEERARRL